MMRNGKRSDCHGLLVSSVASALPVLNSCPSPCPRVARAVSAWLLEAIVTLQSPRYPLCCCQAGWTSIHYTAYRSPAFHCFHEAGPKAARKQSARPPLNHSLTHLHTLGLGQFHEAVAARRVTTTSRLKRSETPACPPQLTSSFCSNRSPWILPLTENMASCRVHPKPTPGHRCTICGGPEQVDKTTVACIECMRHHHLACLHPTPQDPSK